MRVDKHLCEDIASWLYKYLTSSGLSKFVIGVSGGVDSALTSTLCAETGKPTIVVNIPINSKRNNTELSNSHCHWLKKKYDNVEIINIDMSDVYNLFKKTVSDYAKDDGLALANTKSRMRMVLLYYLAGINHGIVVGTGNKIEDFGVGFYTKYGDGGVDISPIADLNKTQVRQCAQIMGIQDNILSAPPTDGLWEDDRTD